MGTTPSLIFREQLNSLLRGAPINLERLTDAELTSKAVARLSADGWLKRLGRGVYFLPGLHVGGKTALAWRGVRHNISMQEVLSLWGTGHTPIPPWFRNPCPSLYQATNLFDEGLPGQAGIAPLPASNGAGAGVCARARPPGTPERRRKTPVAGGNDPPGREPSLAACASPGAADGAPHAHQGRPLAVALATSLGLPWRDIAARHSKRLGGGERWVARARTGERIDLRGPA